MKLLDKNYFLYFFYFLFYFSYLFIVIQPGQPDRQPGQPTFFFHRLIFPKIFFDFVKVGCPSLKIWDSPILSTCDNLSLSLYSVINLMLLYSLVCAHAIHYNWWWAAVQRRYSSDPIDMIRCDVNLFVGLDLLQICHRRKVTYIDIQRISS